VKLFNSELDGKKIAYSDETEFLVQLGKGKGSYKTKWHFKGSLSQAVSYYNAINIGNGYKKRLLMPSSKKPILAVQRS
jgi:hypothetical protein